MVLYKLDDSYYLGSVPEATPTDSEHNIDDIYDELHDVKGQMQLLNEKEVVVNVETATSSDSSQDIASLTDAVQELQKTNNNIYQWCVVIAFIIVILEVKKMFRGSIKKWIDS